MAETAAPDAEQVMRDYFDLRNGDRSKLSVLADSFTFSHPFGEVHGGDELVEMQLENERAMADTDLEVDEMLVGDGVAMWKWTMSGTHDGEWQGIPPTGREVELEGMSMTVIADGKVQSNRAYFDSQNLLSQLGATDE
ncbi:ester cyclase [Natronorarus salvus]|uniref:ester cyclase n=1 Tax=Natronorarus salvus TaxID=3117733 RepID=UPI002F26A0D6